MFGRGRPVNVDAILFKIVLKCANKCLILTYNYVQNPWRTIFYMWVIPHWFGILSSWAWTWTNWPRLNLAHACLNIHGLKYMDINTVYSAHPSTLLPLLTKSKILQPELCVRRTVPLSAMGKSHALRPLLCWKSLAGWVLCHTTIVQTHVDFVDFHRRVKTGVKTNSWMLMSSFDMTSFSFQLTCPI